MTPRPLIIDNICSFILVWGESALRSVPLWANILHCLSAALVYNHTLYSTGSCFPYENSAEVTTRSLSAGAFELSSLSESKRNLTQHDNAKEPLNEIDSGVLKSQVWFHIALTSAGAPPISSRQTHGTRSSSTFTVTSAGEESVETKQKKVLTGPFVSVRTPLIFLLTL